MSLIYSRRLDALTQAGGAVVVPVDFNANTHQIGTRKTGGTAGTLAVEVKPRNCDTFEPLTQNGAQVTLALGSDLTFGPFMGSFDELRFTPTGFNGTSYSLTVAGWD